MKYYKAYADLEQDLKAAHEEIGRLRVELKKLDMSDANKEQSSIDYYEPYRKLRDENRELYADINKMQHEFEQLEERDNEGFDKLKAENERLTKQLETAVVLPCKVGDTVYWLYSKGATGWYNDIRVCKVSSISISEHYIEIHSERTSLNDTNFWGRIGDNVFLTKESAEARLKELKENKR